MTLVKTQPVTTLKRQATKILTQLTKDRSPVLITRHGIPTAYLVDVGTFEALRNRLRILEGSVRDVGRGKPQPYEPCLVAGDFRQTPVVVIPVARLRGAREARRLRAPLVSAAAASDAESPARRAEFMALDHHDQEAREMLEEALKLDPKLAIAHESMGFLLSQQGKVDEATKWYSQAVALNSQSCMANYFYAVSLLKGRLDDHAAAQAESSLRAAIKIAPDFAPAYSALGWLLATRHQNLEEACRMTLTAVALEPGDVHHRFNSAQVLVIMGRADDAVRAAQIASAMAKTPEDQAQALAILSNAQRYQEFQKRVKEREEAFRKAQADVALAASSHPGQAAPAGTATPEFSALGQESAQPPVLRHRDEAPGGNTPIVSSGTALSSHPPRPELLPTRLRAEGTITDVRCSGGSTFEISLDSTTGVMQLYSDDYLKISYNALNFAPRVFLTPVPISKAATPASPTIPEKANRNKERW